MNTATINSALDTLRDAGQTLADAREAYARNEMAKAEHEAGVATALIGQNNPATNKPHSDTSAKAAAKQDERVCEYREQRIVLARAVTLAEVNYLIAEIGARAVAQQQRAGGFS